MSGTAQIHQATLTPTKLELLATWLPQQAWFSAPTESSDESLRTVGSYRFVDPDDEVGIETLLVASSGATYQVPLTYRSAPLDEADAALVGTLEHSVLGKRWVYDATADPVYAAELIRVIREGDTQAAARTADGAELPASVQVTGSGVDAVADTSGMVRIVRLIDDPEFSTERARGLLTGTWGEHPDEALLAVLR